jgi:radical SAM protein with 4Fe4S-binding SPASM domain
MDWNRIMNLFDINTGMIHVDNNPSTLEELFDSSNHKIGASRIKQARVGVEAEYIDDSPCKNCKFKLTCAYECDEFKKYLDPLEFERKIEKEVALILFECFIEMGILR